MHPIYKPETAPVRRPDNLPFAEDELPHGLPPVREAAPASSSDAAPLDIESLKEQSEAWEAVFYTLQEVSPGWLNGDDTGIEMAVSAIRRLAAPVSSGDALSDVMAALSRVFMTLESDGDGSRKLVLKFNQREDAYTVHQFLLDPAAGRVATPAADPKERLKPIMSLTGYELYGLLEAAWPDRDTDHDQGDTRLQFWKREVGECIGGDNYEPGLYFYWDDIPEEGSVPVFGEPPTEAYVRRCLPAADADAIRSEGWAVGFREQYEMMKTNHNYRQRIFNEIVKMDSAEGLSRFTRIAADADAVRDAAYEHAAHTIELFDDKTMEGDYMLDAGECAGIIRALKSDAIRAAMSASAAKKEGE